jgi:hypothetical protein
VASLRDFWRFLDARGSAGLRAVLSEWQDRCGPAFSSIEPLLEPSGLLARSWPGERPDLPRRRVVTSSGAAVAVCDEGMSPRVELSPRDRALYQLPPTALRSAIAAALGLRTSTMPVDRTPGMLRLGAWEPRPGLAFGVGLVAHGETGVFANLVRAAVLGDGKPMIMLTPTAALWTDELRAWVEQRRGILVPADEAIDAGSDGLVATEAWGSFLEMFVARAGVSLAGAVQNGRPKKKRAERLATIEKIETVLVATARSRVDMIRASIDADRGIPTIPHLTRAALAEEAGCKPHDVTRVFQDAAGKQVAKLYELVNDAEALWRTRGSRGAR